MKVSLVFPPFHHPALYNLPPLGLINLATVARLAGHEAQVIDLILELREGQLPGGQSLYRACAERIAAAKPEVVAFGAQCTTYPPTVHIAREVRRLVPEARIVLGGHNASFVARQTLESFSWIDAVVRGEGEETFGELLDVWARAGTPGGVAGLSWRSGGMIHENPDRPLLDDLNVLPLPDYSLAPALERYRRACGLSRAIAILEVGRGCPHRCVYCSESALWRRRCRTFAVERLVEEMTRLRDLQGAECFLLAYDQFTAERQFVENFCRQVMDAGLHRLGWYCISRLDTVDADLLRLMRAAGCESLCYGIDSGSARTLAFIRKQIDPGQLGQRVRETTAAGIVPTLSFVVGFPEEERVDIDATLLLALQTGIEGNSNPLMQIPTVLPGTELHARYGPRLVREVDSYFAQGIEFDAGRRCREDEELIDSDPLLFSSFYNLPSRALPLPELELLAAEFPVIVNLYPKTFRILCAALETPPSILFVRLRSFARAEAAQGLTPAVCFACFPRFVAGLADQVPGAWRHVFDMLTYESRAIEAARPGAPSAAGNADLSGVSTWRPAVAKNLALAELAFDMEAIVTDLRAGKVRADYPHSPSLLVFRQAEGRLEVSAVNAFAHDLLRRCDGQAVWEDIARSLYARHGAGSGEEQFVSDCRAALMQLRQHQWLSPHPNP
ncbi:B12-binding domain-containing radical SAM protein [Geoalkalibacter halelectricus]|uniref:B12-binding domain-containing radical SAM protein n=1 Tax=Geoalkalibacter halelectricus TaxID=2847045 RepID=A0ABY5ZJ01_9BACT|nr:B12-binding domain-containing radical SAM protein [Geoalkalibacter halelectricus]MDO3378924.1 B12-binding domain-containing radical SAM protein [Geoalkalibacter halelectricus]UWZ79053.1 B12-binding domain-containing radical SAM protein [Geoalkalibacter halelectricus]